MDRDLTEDQQAALNDTLERGTAFEEMTRTKGFEHVKAYYQARLTLFINDIFNNDHKPLAEFEGQRSELLGLKRLLGEIDNALKVLHDERQRTR